MAQPDLLLRDEPSQGLGPGIVEQRVVEALELCDRGYVLETGRVALDRSHATLLADPRVHRAYLGA